MHKSMQEFAERNATKISLPFITAICQLLYFSIISSNFSLKEYTLIIIADLLIGLIIGIPIDSFRDSVCRLNKATLKAIESQQSTDKYLSRAFNAIDSLMLGHEARKLLKKSQKHKDILLELLDFSVNRTCFHIPRIGVDAYLNFLTKAILSSSTFFGVQRHPISWFFKDDDEIRKSYLSKLCLQEMTRKIRLFVISKDEISLMKEELSLDSMLDQYWSNTGDDVESYWIEEDTLMRLSTSFCNPFEDFALFDNELLICYNEEIQTLSFKIVDPEDVQLILLNSLNEYSPGYTSPFKTIRKLA